MFSSRFFLLVCGIVIALLMTNCKKFKAIKGCTDPIATNYDPEANVDNCYCQYSAYMVFWYNKAYSQNRMSLGDTTWHYFVNDYWTGSVDLTNSWEEAPWCDDFVAATHSVNVGSPDSTLEVTYRVDNQNHVTVKAGVITLSMDVCHAIQFTQ